MMRVSAALLVILSTGRIQAQSLSTDWRVVARPRTNAPTPTTAAITIADLRSRLFRIADDSMLGRLAGTAGNAKTVEYVAREFKRLGLRPAGDSGTFFQTLPVFRRVLDESIDFSLEGQRLKPWEDFLPRDGGMRVRAIDGVPTIYAGIWGENTLLPSDAARGKVVVVGAHADEQSGGIPGVPNRSAVATRYSGAVGIAVVALGRIPQSAVNNFKTSAPALLDERDSAPATLYLYISDGVARTLFGPNPQPGQQGPAFHGRVAFTNIAPDAPVRNVVAILPGNDPRLRSEFVAIGAHNDHVGTDAPVAHDSAYATTHLFAVEGADSPPPRLGQGETERLNAGIAAMRTLSHGTSARTDSVDNGADDDGSGTAALLEIAEYFASGAVRPRRSLLFVSHVGEEEGLWGSQFFTDHPSVPRDSIVAQLNMDMIGRGGPMDVTGTTKDGREIFGGPDYLQLVGSRRLSTELGDVVEHVNKSNPRPLTLDYSMDANGHPQNIYCRSDHYMYARYGIPIVFFTTGGHADYHQVTDEPQYIDYDRLQRVATLVARVAANVANLDHRPVVDKPKPDPHGACQQ